MILTGPTGVGKTALAVALVAAGPFDIVSADSAMVYRGMDIGTAKPDAATLARAPHRLIDICDPEESYSAARFRQDALAEMASIRDAGRVPLLVGGTLLYLRALTQGLAELPSADADVRARLEEELEARGLGAMHGRLAKVDPIAARRIHANDRQRTLRALEVWEITGTPLSVLLREQAAETQRSQPYHWLKLASLPPDRALLHRRIVERFAGMLAAGLEREVRALMARPGFDPDLPAMRSVGYRQVIGYLSGEYDHATMVERAVSATRQLAKRQLTWIRGDTEFRHLSASGVDALPEVLGFLEEIKG